MIEQSMNATGDTNVMARYGPQCSRALLVRFVRLDFNINERIV